MATMPKMRKAEISLASPYGTPLLNSHCHAWSCAPAWFLRKVKGADCR